MNTVTFLLFAALVVVSSLAVQQIARARRWQAQARVSFDDGRLEGMAEAFDVAAEHRAAWLARMIERLERDEDENR